MTPKTRKQENKKQKKTRGIIGPELVTQSIEKPACRHRVLTGRDRHSVSYYRPRWSIRPSHSQNKPISCFVLHYSSTTVQQYIVLLGSEACHYSSLHIQLPTSFTLAPVSFSGFNSEAFVCVFLDAQQAARGQSHAKLQTHTRFRSAALTGYI